MPRRLLVLLLLVACKEREPAAPPPPVLAPQPRARVVVKVEHGTFATSLETRLEAELLVAMAQQLDLEVISFAAAEQALLRQRTCDPENEFATCRVRQLRLAADFAVELSLGVVPGTWVLTTALTPAGGTLSWLPTLPFTQQSGERLDEAVARAARELGRSLQTTGLRPGSSFAPARPVLGVATKVASLCADFNAPWLPLGDLAWQTRTAVRAQLHQRDTEPALEMALNELDEASKPGPAHCSQLATLVAWQERAVSTGWLPGELKTERWRGNVDILVRGSAPDGDAVGASLAGAFALRGLTLHGIRPAPQRCEPAPDCIEGVPASDVRPTVWVMLADVSQTEGKLEVVGRLLVPDGEGVRAVALPKIEAKGKTALKPSVDFAVDKALEQLGDIGRR